ncbi:MAG: diguanylate cyclase, partial [Burkholderiales bacterium]
PAEGSMQVAAALAGRLCKAVEAMALPHDGQEDQAVVTVSIGLAGLRASSDRAPADLMDGADRQLYVAKRTGRNRWVRADPVLSAAPSLDTARG